MPSEQRIQTLKFGDYILELSPEEQKKYPEFKYRTLRKYYFHYRGKRICIPKGFLTDGPSIEEPYHSYFLKAFFEQWLIHDFIYATHKINPKVPQTRLRADKFVLDTLAPIWTVVCLGGGTLFNMYRFKTSGKWMDQVLDEAWRESGDRGPIYYQSEN